jgi:hypothetical protein
VITSYQEPENRQMVRSIAGKTAGNQWGLMAVSGTGTRVHELLFTDLKNKNPAKNGTGPRKKTLIIGLIQHSKRQPVYTMFVKSNENIPMAIMMITAIKVVKISVFRILFISLTIAHSPGAISAGSHNPAGSLLPCSRTFLNDQAG